MRRNSLHQEIVCLHPVVRDLPSLTLVCGCSGLSFRFISLTRVAWCISGLTLQEVVPGFIYVWTRFSDIFAVLWVDYIEMLDLENDTFTSWGYRDVSKVFRVY